MSMTKPNASQVIFDPVGVGAVPTTVQEALRRTVSVKDFDAVGDGVADDTAEVQAAFDAVPVGGLLFVNGLFKITGTITISKPVRIIGYSYGYGSERTGFINAADTALKMFSVRAHYVSFENVLISGAGKTGTSIGIEVGDGVTNYDKFCFSNNSTVIGFRYGIDLRSQNATLGGGATVSTCGTGVLLSGVPGALNNRNIHFNQFAFHSCNAGLEQNGSYHYGIGVTGCDFNDCTNYGIVGNFRYSSFTGNTFIYGGNDIYVVGDNVSITGNSLGGASASNQGDGIYISGNYNTVTSNTIINKPWNGINSSGVGNVIVANTVFDCNGVNASGYSGIKVAGDSTRVAGNISRTSSGGASGQEYGIQVVSGSNVIVSLNQVDGNKIAQVTGNAIIINNTGYVTSSYGEVLIPSGATSVSFNHGLSITPPAGSVMLTMAGAATNAKQVRIIGYSSTQVTIASDVAPGTGAQLVWWNIQT